MRPSAPAFVLAVLLAISPFLPLPALASTQQEVYITGHVQSFGGYTVTEGISFAIEEPGE